MRFKLLDVTLQNFMSYGNKPAKFDFTQPETVLIVGNNEDVGEVGESKNGAGKSVSFGAIVYALYGEGVNKLKADEMINLVNEKKMLVELNFESYGQPYRIVRGRKPNVLEFYKGEKSLTADSMKNTDLAIQEVLGINYDTFLISFLMNTSTTPFMARKPTEQKQFMEDNLGLTLLTKRADTLKMFRGEYETESKITARELEVSTEKNEQTKKQIEKSYEYAEDFEYRRKAKIEQLQSFINDRDQYDLPDIRDRLIDIDSRMSEYRSLIPTKRDEQRKIERSAKELDTKIKNARETRVSVDKDKEHLTARVVELTSSITKLIGDIGVTKSNIGPFSDLYEKYDAYISIVENDIPGYEKEIKAQNLEMDKVEKKYERNESELTHLLESKCPYCKQQYSDDEAQNKIDSLKSDNSVLEKKFVSIEEEIAATQLKLNKLSETIDSTSDEVKNFNPEDLTSLENDLRMYEAQLTNSESELERAQAKLDSLEVDYSFDIEKAEVELHGLFDEYDVMEEVIVDLEQKQTSVQSELNDLPFKSEREVENVIMELSQKKAEIETENQAINHHVHQAEDLKASLVSLDDLKKSVEELDEKVKHVNYLIKLLTNSKSFIRKDIINQYIGFLNKKVNEYTQVLGLPHFIEFKSDLTVDVEYMRKQVSYYNLSAGERLRLDIAVSLAFRAMLAMVGSTSNVLFVDELLDSAMDASGVRNAFKLFKGYADHVSLISHRGDLDTMVDRVMVISKKNGFSVVN